MYLDGLDELDQKIIQLLIENARISYSDIGKETGISRVAVKARIQALEKKGVIEEYTTIINPQKISGAVSCYFEIETKPDSLSQVTDILYKNDTVTQIYRVTGRDKLHVHAVASLRVMTSGIYCPMCKHMVIIDVFLLPDVNSAAAASTDFTSTFYIKY